MAPVSYDVAEALRRARYHQPEAQRPAKRRYNDNRNPVRYRRPPRDKRRSR